MSEDEEVSVSRSRESVEIGARRQGKSLRTAEMVKRELDRGTAVFMSTKAGGFSRIVDVEFDVPLQPYQKEIAGALEDPKTKVIAFRPYRFRARDLDAELSPSLADMVAERARELSARIGDAREQYLLEAFGTTTQQVTEQPPEITLEKMAEMMREGTTHLPVGPEIMEDSFFYRPTMELDRDSIDRPWKHYLDAYPLYAPINPHTFMNVGDFGEPYVPWVRPPWTPPDRAERALALLAARPLDRRRIKRCRRIMGLSR